MEIKSVRVMKKMLICKNCDTEFFGYSEVPEEPKLFECNECSAIFSLESAAYQGPAALEKQIQGKCCPDCDAPLEEVLEEKTQAGSCPMCEDRDYYGTGEPEEVQLETYSL